MLGRGTQELGRLVGAKVAGDVWDPVLPVVSVTARRPCDLGGIPCRVVASGVRGKMMFSASGRKAAPRFTMLMSSCIGVPGRLEGGVVGEGGRASSLIAPPLAMANLGDRKARGQRGVESLWSQCSTDCINTGS